jgi:hypothetical protein
MRLVESALMGDLGLLVAPRFAKHFLQFHFDRVGIHRYFISDLLRKIYNQWQRLAE